MHKERSKSFHNVQSPPLSFPNCPLSPPHLSLVLYVFPVIFLLRWHWHFVVIFLVKVDETKRLSWIWSLHKECYDGFLWVRLWMSIVVIYSNLEGKEELNRLDWLTNGRRNLFSNACTYTCLGFRGIKAWFKFVGHEVLAFALCMLPFHIICKLLACYSWEVVVNTSYINLLCLYKVKKYFFYNPWIDASCM